MDWHHVLVMRMRIRSQRAIIAGAMVREVICDFEGRRRPVSFYCSQLDSAKEAHDNLSAVKTVFSDIISWKEKVLSSMGLQDARLHTLMIAPYIIYQLR